ncbi:hypothetical protein [Nitrosomonas sp. Nm58]|jgi:hypothetical protein|uniref:hypothetical protein n=1 Tax=Nitrosomonas sp. Nm58 TaxID=200126 RepID=UPI0008984521|nr:hypothetical protein [Nitrosomonas sp. Nm58]SDY39040.1 hypothetical protein SAMN05421754_100867 [Nitrosomonas sp. Nm58]
MVKRLLCTLPNASNDINGIEFEPYELGGMVSVKQADDLGEVVIRKFLKIGGYKLIDVDAKSTGNESVNQPIVEDGGVKGAGLSLSQSGLAGKHKKIIRSKDKENTNE